MSERRKIGIEPAPGETIILTVGDYDPNALQELVENHGEQLAGRLIAESFRSYAVALAIFNPEVRVDLSKLFVGVEHEGLFGKPDVFNALPPSWQIGLGADLQSAGQTLTLANGSTIICGRRSESKAREADFFAAKP